MGWRRMVWWLSRDENVLSRIRALLLGDHYPSLIIIFLFFLSSTEVSKFVFSCRVQALEEFILFSLELVRKNYEKRSVE